MRLRDVMTHSVYTLQPTQSVEEAIRFFIKHGVKGAPVVEKGKVVGLVSEKDIFRALYPSIAEFYNNPELWMEEAELEGNAKLIAAKSVKDIMTRAVVSAPPDTPIMQAGAMMLAHRVHRIVVLESGRLLGIATRSDVFKNVFKKFIG
ncbi:MAG: CBS domain-containing protein [Patescibacteria group bacterium]